MTAFQAWNQKLRIEGQATVGSPPSKPTRPRACSAFTRADLLITLGVLALLALVILPALANQRPRSARVSCANNLRQIGVGFQLWGDDHKDRLPQETSLRDGGTSIHDLAPNVWLHLSWISNEVVTPSVYLCPSDTGQPAQDFSANPASGYLHPNFRHRATSYFLSHSSEGRPGAPEAVIAGDRNLTGDTAGGCSRFKVSQMISRPLVLSGGQWTSALHNGVGNVLNVDGRVQQLNNAGLRPALYPVVTDSYLKHFITPR